MTSIVTEPSQDKHHSSNFSNLTAVQLVFIKLMVLVPIPGGFKDVDHFHQEKTLKVLKVKHRPPRYIQVSQDHLSLREYGVYPHWRTHFLYLFIYIVMYTNVYIYIHIYYLCNIGFLCLGFVRIPHNLQSSLVGVWPNLLCCFCCECN